MGRRRRRAKKYIYLLYVARTVSFLVTKPFPCQSQFVFSQKLKKLEIQKYALRAHVRLERLIKIFIFYFIFYFYITFGDVSSTRDYTKILNPNQMSSDVKTGKINEKHFFLNIINYDVLRTEEGF